MLNVTKHFKWSAIQFNNYSGRIKSRYSQMEKYDQGIWSTNIKNKREKEKVRGMTLEDPNVRTKPCSTSGQMLGKFFLLAICGTWMLRHGEPQFKLIQVLLYRP